MDANTATEIVSKVNDWVEVAGLVVMALVVVSTILVKLAGFIVKFTKSPTDDIAVAKFEATIHKIAVGILEAMVFFPTLGKNPKTKMLEKQLKAADPSLLTIQVQGSIEEVKAQGDGKAD